MVHGSRAGPTLVLRSAKQLHEHVGQHILSPAAERVAGGVARRLSFAGSDAVQEIFPGPSNVVPMSGETLRAAVKSAGGKVVKGIGIACAGGMIVEGFTELIHGVKRHREGEASPDTIVRDVARKAAVGSASAAAGTATAAAAVVATGGTALPYVLGIGAGAAEATREQIDRWLDGDSVPDQAAPPASTQAIPF